MPYKTIILELLQGRPELHDHLREQRMLLAVMDTCATALKSRHEALKGTLAAVKPELDLGQIASMAMEIAVQEMESRLQNVFPPHERQPLSLDHAVAFLRSLTPHD